jgi:hypothetical protein
MLLLAAIGSWGVGTIPALAAGGNRAALAAVLNDATATLQDGLKASEFEGTAISAKFEIADGRLQISVYTLNGSDFIEVVVDPKTGAISKAEKITDAEDLKAATSQKGAMAKASMPLLMAAETAVKANACFRAVSIFPELKNGETNAEVTLSAWGLFKKITQKLDCANTLCSSRRRHPTNDGGRAFPAKPLSASRRCASVKGLRHARGRDFQTGTRRSRERMLDVPHRTSGVGAAGVDVGIGDGGRCNHRENTQRR